MERSVNDGAGRDTRSLTTPASARNARDVDDPYDVYLPPKTRPEPAPAVDVRRGPEFGRWTARTRVRDTADAERLVGNWRQRYPREVAAIFVDGAPAEDRAQRERRLLLERISREISYLIAFAADAEAEGQPDDARQYRRCAEQLAITLRDAKAGGPR